MVDSLLEVTEGAAGKQIANLPGDGGLQRFLQSGADQVGNAFGDLESHIAHKTVGYDNVNMAVEQVASFHIAHKIQRKPLKQTECVPREFIALIFFLADG